MQEREEKIMSILRCREKAQQQEKKAKQKKIIISISSITAVIAIGVTGFFISGTFFFNKANVNATQNVQQKNNKNVDEISADTQNTAQADLQTTSSQNLGQINDVKEVEIEKRIRGRISCISSDLVKKQVIKNKTVKKVNSKKSKEKIVDKQPDNITYNNDNYVSYQVNESPVEKIKPTTKTTSKTLKKQEAPIKQSTKPNTEQKKQEKKGEQADSQTNQTKPQANDEQVNQTTQEEDSEIIIIKK